MIEDSLCCFSIGNRGSSIIRISSVQPCNCYIRFTLDDYDEIKPFVGLYSRFTWFYKLSRFMKHRKKLHDLEKILSRRFKENKPQFTFFFNGKDFEISLLDNKESKHLQELLKESIKALKIFLNLQQRFRDELLLN